MLQPFVFEEVARWAPSLRLVALYLTALLALLFLALMLAAGESFPDRTLQTPPPAGLVFMRESGRKPAEPRAESGRIEQRPARQTRNT